MPPGCFNGPGRLTRPLRAEARQASPTVPLPEKTATSERWGWALSLWDGGTGVYLALASVDSTVSALGAARSLTVVYLADDLKHDRGVAFLVVP